VPGTQTTTLRAIAGGNGRFVAVGSKGTFLQSGPIVSLALSQDRIMGSRLLSLEGPTGLSCTASSLRSVLSLDHDPLFQFQRWQANLRILGIEVVQTVPLVPWSHPFVERLIRCIRSEYLDRLFFWNAADLEQKLESFRLYYNASRVHQGLAGETPDQKAGGPARALATLAQYRWQPYCGGLVQLPIAA
jgi:hypothetical protein